MANLGLPRIPYWSFLSRVALKWCVFMCVAQFSKLSMPFKENLAFNNKENESRSTI